MMEARGAEGVDVGAREHAGRPHRRASGRATWAPLAWLTVLVLTGAVQLVRGALSDAVIFGAAAAVLAGERLGLLPLLDRMPRASRAPLLVGAAAAAVVLCLAPRHSLAAGLAMGGVAIGVLAAAWPPPRALESAHGPWPRALRLLGWGWAIIWIAGCLWEVRQVTAGAAVAAGRTRYPALSDLLDPVLNTVVGKVVFVVLWLGAGLFLLHRARPQVPEPVEGPEPHPVPEPVEGLPPTQKGIR